MSLFVDPDVQLVAAVLLVLALAALFVGLWVTRDPYSGSTSTSSTTWSTVTTNGSSFRVVNGCAPPDQNVTLPQGGWICEP